MGLSTAPRLLGYSMKLSALADNLELALQTPVYQVYLPFGILGLLHAVRVSHGIRQVSGGLKSKLNLYQSVLLHQILLFSGAILSSLLLGLPCPVLASGEVMLLYAGTHVVLGLSGIGSALLRLNEIWLLGLSMDIFFAALDGIFRADGVQILGVDAVRAHYAPLISSSHLAAIINGAVIGGAGPLFIDLFRLDSVTGDWNIRTPRWIKDPFAGTQDLFSAAVISAAYLALIDKSFSATLTPYVGRLGELLSLDAGDGITLREARTISVVLLTSILVAQRLAAVPAELTAVTSAGPEKNKPNCSKKTVVRAADGLAVPQIASNGSSSKKLKAYKGKCRCRASEQDEREVDGMYRFQPVRSVSATSGIL